MIMRLCTLLRLMSHGSSLDYLVWRSISGAFYIVKNTNNNNDCCRSFGASQEIPDMFRYIL